MKTEEVTEENNCYDAGVSNQHQHILCNNTAVAFEESLLFKPSFILSNYSVNRTIAVAFPQWS